MIDRRMLLFVPPFLLIDRCAELGFHLESCNGQLAADFLHMD